MKNIFHLRQKWARSKLEDEAKFGSSYGQMYSMKRICVFCKQFFPDEPEEYKAALVQTHFTSKELRVIFERFNHRKELAEVAFL